MAVLESCGVISRWITFRVAARTLQSARGPARPLWLMARSPVGLLAATKDAFASEEQVEVKFNTNI